MKILIVSDTHRKDGNLTGVLDMVGTPDLLIHCGDVEGSEDFIKSIAGCPVHMVAGNNDFFYPSEKRRGILYREFQGMADARA